MKPGRVEVFQMQLPSGEGLRAYYIKEEDAAFLRSIESAVAAEREACAKVCDAQGSGRKAMEHYAALTYVSATNDCAAAIRARGET